MPAYAVPLTKKYELHLPPAALLSIHSKPGYPVNSIDRSLSVAQTLPLASTPGCSIQTKLYDRQDVELGALGMTLGLTLWLT